MRIYILKPITNLRLDPWSPWFDKAFGFIVQAEDNRSARILAASDAGDEGGDAWLNNKFTSCVELLVDDGPAEVIMKDFASA